MSALAAIIEGDEEDADEPPEEPRSLRDLLDEFLDQLEQPRTREAYARRLREMFAAMGKTEVNQVDEDTYNAFTRPDPDELFIAVGSVGRQARAALRSFCRWAYINQEQGLDPGVVEAIRADLSLIEGQPEGLAERAAAGGALRKRNLFAAALLRAGLHQNLSRLRVADLLVDTKGECWLATDLPGKYRGTLERGAWLCRMTSGLRRQALQARAELQSPRSGDALLLGATGAPASMQALRQGIARLGGDQELALLTTHARRLPELDGLPRPAAALLREALSKTRLSFRQLERRCGVPAGYWWSAIAVGRRSRIRLGVLAKAAIAVDVGVRDLLIAAGVDPKGIPRADGQRGRVERLTLPIPDCW